MKPLQIKIWPEIKDYVPSLIPLPNLGAIENDIQLDFSSCRELNSSGLCILLIQIIKAMQVKQKYKRMWQIDYPRLHLAEKRLKELEFLSILQTYYPNEKLQLFSQRGRKTTAPKKSSLGFEGIQSFPIYRLPFTRNHQRRQAIRPFKEWLLSILSDIRRTYLFHHTQLMVILNEMAKNSADHTNDDAFFGLDIVHSLSDNHAQILFCFGDLGVGIKQHVQQSLKTKSLEKRAPHWSHYESYFLALRHGYTSKPMSSENRGIGMSIILDGSNGIGMDLSVFDARSRGILTDIREHTHAELRKCFFNLGNDVGFYYFGKIRIDKI